jgi:hypothetical protein
MPRGGKSKNFMEAIRCLILQNADSCNADQERSTENLNAGRCQVAPMNIPFAGNVPAEKYLNCLLRIEAGTHFLSCPV